MPVTTLRASLLSSYIDSNKQVARISVNMKDIGSRQLPILLDSLQQHADQLYSIRLITT